jgi:hypothetical protein
MHFCCIHAALLAFATLTACTAHSPLSSPRHVPQVAVRPVPPATLTHCPEGAPLPDPPKRPRTIEQVVAWAGKTSDAWSTTERAREICSDKLDELNAWIYKN